MSISSRQPEVFQTPSPFLPPTPVSRSPQKSFSLPQPTIVTPPLAQVLAREEESILASPHPRELPQMPASLPQPAARAAPDQALVRAEKDRKSKEEEEVRQLELRRKCHAVAKRIFPEMIKMYYTPDGQLNNEYQKDFERTRFWGVKGEKDPQKLRGLAKKCKDSAQAEEYRRQADENEKARDEYLASDEFQQTLLPLIIDGHEITLEQFLQDSTEKDLHDRVFFHGTTKACAQQILKEGFNPEYPASLRALDTGYGIYLALREQDARRYAGEDGVVLRIKPQKIKAAQYNSKMCHVFQNRFTDMANLCIRRNESSIRTELEKEGVSEIDRSLLENIKYPLVNLFTRDFFERQGYQGVYSYHSDLAGCEYINIFDRENITVLES